MSANLLRTIISWVVIILPPVLSALGCTADAAGNLNCSASWLSPTHAIFLSSGLTLLVQIMKAFGQGGTVVENLTKPSVVVTPEAKVGTVTPAQVNSPHKLAA